MIHKPYDRTIVVAPHATAANVGSTLLQRGMFGIYDTKDTDKDGMKPVLNFAGRDKNEKRYVIRAGRGYAPLSRSTTDKAFSSQVFSINEITGVFASAPQRKEMNVDDVIIGFNGNDDKTGFSTKKGQSIKIDLHISGRQLEYYNFDKGIDIVEHISFDNCSFLPNQCEDCDPCEEVDCLEPTLKAIERMKKQPVAGGSHVEDFVEITPVHKCATAPAAPTTTDMNYFCLEACDTGDDYALALIQAQYPDLKINRVSRTLSTSKYQVLTDKTTMTDYEQKLSSIMKGCEDCPEGYTAVEGGYIYSVAMEDEGEDKKTDVEALANAVAGTAEKQDGQYFGVGLYTVACSKKPTAAEIKTFVTANPSATITLIAKTADMCSNPTVEKTKWAKCGSCKVSTEKYYITVPDDECGNSKLEDVQAAYPDLTITDYGTPAACMHSFQTTVITNMVCAECDPVFEDFYKSEAPAPYANIKWVKQEATPATSGCLCGIRFRSKTFFILPSDCLVGKISYQEDATRLSVQGGYLDDFTENSVAYAEPLAVTWISTWAPVTHRGANLIDDEMEGMAYFTGDWVHEKYMARELLNEQPMLDLQTQYADIAVTLLTVRDSNGFGRSEAAHTTLHFLVEYGAHEGVLDMVNMMAASANVSAAKI